MIEVREKTNPFPGLRPFEPEEDYLFFGRARQIDELLRRLRSTRFLSVIGGSGSGKSSVVRSGLIPALHGGFMSRAGSGWRVAILRPGEDPIGSLTSSLDLPGMLRATEEPDEISRALIETTLRSSPRGLNDAIEQAGLPQQDNVLLVVDQFEELFRFKESRGSHRSRADALAFVNLILQAASHPYLPIYVVLTMRSEFVGRCAEFPEFPEAVNEGQYLVPRMTRDELCEAIVGPVAVGRGEIASRLVMRLLNDVGDDPDQLPVMQHALMRTWDWWEQHRHPGEPLDLRHYEAVGTMEEALSLHADEAYEELGDDRLRKIAERLWKSLTYKERDGQGVRRPCRLDDLCRVAQADPADMVKVIESFRRPGRSFLMPPADVELHGDSIIDLSHESLMRLWTRLIRWVDEEAGAASFYLRLSRAAGHHERGEADLWRETELDLGRTWRQENRPTAGWAQLYDPHFERSMAFLEKSQQTRDAWIAQQRKERRLKLVRRMAAVVGAILLAFGGVALWQHRKIVEVTRTLTRIQTVENPRLEERAEAAEAEARAAEERAREAEAVLTGNDPLREETRKRLEEAENKRQEVESKLEETENKLREVESKLEKTEKELREAERRSRKG